MSNQVQWFPYLDADAEKFTLYRAITGIKVPFPSDLVAGDRLVFAATSPTQQTVVFSSGNINTVIADINAQGKGIRARKSSDGSQILIRCTAKNNARFKLMKCSFAEKAGITPRTVAPRTEFYSVAEIEAVPGQTLYTYNDVDGDPEDWYRLTSTSTDCEESLPTQAMKAIGSNGETCTIDGRIMGLNNEALAGLEVSAELMGETAYNAADLSEVSEAEIVTYTDELGRWYLALTKNQLVLLDIPSIGYNEVIRVPDQAYVLFSDLKPVNDHYFSPKGE